AALVGVLEVRASPAVCLRRRPVKREDSLMTEAQLDQIHEAYHSAVCTLVTGRGGLRERVREALAWLGKCQGLSVVTPAGEFERQIAKDLPRLLRAAGRLEALAWGELEGLAWDVYRVSSAVDDAFAHRAAVRFGEVPAR